MGESAKAVDWEGKKALIQACQAMKIQRFLFFSLNQCDRYEDVPLMDIKYKTERFLAESGLNYTTFRLCGFMQAIIGNYALPILEERPVWGTTDMTRTAYIDSGDAARLALAAVDREETFGKTLDLSGPRPLAVPEIIALCERYAGQDAQVRNVPVWLLNATRAATNFSSGRATRATAWPSPRSSPPARPSPRPWRRPTACSRRTPRTRPSSRSTCKSTSPRSCRSSAK